MATQSAFFAAFIGEDPAHLVDEAYASDVDCFDWAMSRSVPPGERIWQNLALSAFLHMALALALLAAPLTAINTDIPVFQVQLVSMGGAGELTAGGGETRAGESPAASEAHPGRPAGTADDNSAESADAGAASQPQLIAAETMPVQAESTSPVPEEQPVPVAETSSPAPTPARETMTKNRRAAVRPLSPAKTNLQKTASDIMKTPSDADSRVAAPPSSALGNPQPGDQDGGKAASAGSGEASRAQSGHGSGGSGPLTAQFGSPNGPRFLHKAIPNYPHQARQMEKEGTVVLHVTIDEAGRVAEVELAKSAGHGFDEEAIKAVRNSRFAPAKKDGRPITCKAVLPIRFLLKNTEDF